MATKKDDNLSELFAKAALEKKQDVRNMFSTAEELWKTKQLAAAWYVLQAYSLQRDMTDKHWGEVGT